MHRTLVLAISDGFLLYEMRNHVQHIEIIRNIAFLQRNNYKISRSVAAKKSQKMDICTKLSTSESLIYVRLKSRVLAGNLRHYFAETRTGFLGKKAMNW
jgi:hypothetical protein